MKTATIPSLRVTPELRQEAESVLHDGESLSAFVEQSLRTQIEDRRAHAQFVARALAARDAAKTSGEYISKEDVMDGLHTMLQAKTRLR